MSRPKPDWGRRGTQPKGSAGPKPRPNGQPVATQPRPNLLHLDDVARSYFGAMADLVIEPRMFMSRLDDEVDALRPEDV